MKQELLQRIPRLPHWRWVLFCGAGHPEYTEPVAQLDRYLSEEKIDVGLGDLEDPDEDVSRAIRIFESEPPIRKTIESMLFERCSSTLIQDALYHKYKEPISDVVVRRYKKFFYDTEVLNNYDIAKYYESSSQRIPKPPPVPGSFKEAYVA
nr:hypothetical protein [Candidatus Korarchaeota archaeon]NIU82596.1 hypothetical protein [Candidatus Thorarchaeota archaeon]NIW13080.1 hypothetical protein [Candidatus Thorarchaeota archaeon]NIW51242.1 hypothetical protein [Candidatus Korarchaeota archaeon]